MHVLVRMGEIILATIIIVFVLYKLALTLDMVPEDFSPAGIIHKEYTEFKSTLKSKAAGNDFRASMSTTMLTTILRVEKYIKERRDKQELAAKVAEKCNENPIFRFFMFMGTDDKKQDECIQQNQRLQQELQKSGASAKVAK